jgi:PAS domain-containing protein
MSRRIDTQVLPGLPQENSRGQLLNDVWLLTILAVLVATGVPWIASNFQIDVVPASWGLLALGAIHVALTFMGAPRRRRRGWHGQMTTVLEFVGVLLIGFIWDHVGALQNPLFLMIFVLPVIGAAFLSRWHPYLLAVASIVTVGFVSLSEAPELRWFASGLFGSDVWVVWLFGRDAAATDPSFSSFSAPLNFLIVLLEVFCIGLIACAVAAEYVGIIVGRLGDQTAIARNEAQRGEELWSSLIEQLPLAALLIDPASLKVVAASESAVTHLLPGSEELEGRELFDILKLSYPDIVQELIVGAGGEAPSTVFRVGDNLRLSTVRVLHVMHKERRLALLTIEDDTEFFCLKSILETSEYACVVVDPQGRVLTFNKLIVGLLGGADVGMDAATLLPQPDPGLRWWEPGLTGRRKSHMQIGSRIYQLTTSAIRLPGEEASIFAVSFLPVASGVSADLAGTSSTLITGTLRQLR